MSFWNTSNNAPVVASANVDQNTDMEPIPSGTMLKSIVTEAKWADTTESQKDNGRGGRYISIRWDVIDGEYKKRVVFQKIWVEEENGDKRDKAIQMLAAIDANAGGKLLSLGREPTDSDMMANLCNKPMVIRVAVWATKNSTTDEEMRGNWVTSIFDPTKAITPPAQKAVAPKKEAEPTFDDDIDF